MGTEDKMFAHAGQRLRSHICRRIIPPWSRPSVSARYFPEEAAPVDLDRVIDERSYYDGRFPQEALEWAIANPEKVVPFLLAVLEHTAENPQEVCEEPDFMGHIYAMFILAQFREVRAYPLIVKYFSRPGEDSLEDTGDFVTEELSAVLASVCGGDVGPIRSLFENPVLNEYIRCAALDALVALVVEGAAPRDELVEYLRRLFLQTPRTSPPYVWSHLIGCATDIHPGELMPYITACFEEGLPDNLMIGPEGVDHALRKGREYAL
jgi:hypothetical protein